MRSIRFVSKTVTVYPKKKKDLIARTITSVVN